MAFQYFSVNQSDLNNRRYCNFMGVIQLRPSSPGCNSSATQKGLSGDKKKICLDYTAIESILILISDFRLAEPCAYNGHFSAFSRMKSINKISIKNCHNFSNLTKNRV